jgi:hypothetical protein
MELTAGVRDPNLQEVAVQKGIVSDVHLGTLLDRIEGVATHVFSGVLLQAPNDYDPV